MKEIPAFNSEDEEREFWASQDSTDFLDGAEQVTLEFVESKNISSTNAGYYNFTEVSLMD